MSTQNSYSFPTPHLSHFNNPNNAALKGPASANGVKNNSNGSNQQPPKYVHAVAGASAGLVSALVTCPLDVIRTILQVQKRLPGHTVKYSGTIGTLKTILYEEGIRGCYKGLEPSLLALIPNWAIYFYSYDKFKDVLREYGFQDGPKTHIPAAVAAGILTDICVTPLWMIKTRLQASILDKPSHLPSTPHQPNHSHHQPNHSIHSHHFSPLLNPIDYPSRHPIHLSFAPHYHTQNHPNPTSTYSHNFPGHNGPPHSHSYHNYSPHEQTQRMMTTSPIKYKSTLHAFRTIVREEGVMALFKGLTPQIIGVTHVAIQFPLYEYLKKKIAERTSKCINELSTLQLVVASAVSKASASILAYPHEVLRARFQYQHNDDPNRYKGIFDAVKRIYREEGYRGFYRGMGANLLRVTPAAAITFTTYESVLQRYNAWQTAKKESSSGSQDSLD